MRYIFIFLVILLFSCTESEDLEVFFDDGLSFSNFEIKNISGYKASQDKIQYLENIFKNNYDFNRKEFVFSPDISGYFYSNYQGEKYKTNFHVYVLKYSESPSKNYEVVSFYFDEGENLIWSNCTTNFFSCEKKPIPENRGWFYNI